MHLQLEMVV